MKKKKTIRPQKNESRTSGNAFVVVYTSNGPLGAEVVKGKLSSAGIPALLKYESATSIFPLTVDGLGEVQVLVRAEDVPKARSVLKQKTSRRF